MDILNLYYDHYKETNKLNKEAQKKRDRYYLLLCLIEALSFLLSLKPADVCNIIKGGINSQLKMTLEFSNDIIQTVVWMLIAYISIEYFKKVLCIERQYSYINKLEKKIDFLCGKDSLFNREGEDYQKNYPIVLNLTDLFYKMISPVLFQIINCIKIYKEYNSADVGSLSFVFDFIIFIAVFTITWFYFFEIHDSITTWCKEKIPLVEKVSLYLHDWLKGV